MALSPFLIFYSTQARPYALLVCLVLGSTLALLVALERGERRWWALYAACSCLVMYTQYTAIFVLVAQAAWVLIFRPRARRQLLLANIAAVIAFVPWIPTVVRDAQSFEQAAYGVLDPFTLHSVVRDSTVWAVGQPWTPLQSVPGTGAIVAIMVAMILTVVGLATRLRARRAFQLSARSPVVLPFVLAVAAPGGIVIYSLLRPSIWDPRNLISSWPGLALAGSWLLVNLGKRLRVVTVTLVLAAFAVGAARLMSSSNERPDYAAAAELVVHHGARSWPVAIVPAPGPGPLAAMDPAFAYAGQPSRPLLRIGAPSLQTTLNAPRFAWLPPTPTATSVHQADQAPRGGKLFVIVPGTEPLRSLMAATPVDVPRALGPVLGTGGFGKLMGSVFPPLTDFVRGLRPRFRYLYTRVFPGVYRISVYVFQRK
jgi:4-amino-4-deoxy-L-arabinose transferase-like glycosyltransferase